MSREASFEAIHAAMLAHGFERGRNVHDRNPTYIGSLDVAGRQVRVRVTFPCADFTILPKVVLLERSLDAPRAHAHLGARGSLCYAPEGSLVLDRYRPAESASLVLAISARTLEDVLDGHAAPDVRAEFAQHWNGTRLFVALSPDAHEGDAQLVNLPRDGQTVLAVLTRGRAGLEAFPEAKRCTHDPAWVLRLDCDLDLPPASRLPETLRGLVRWADVLQAGLGARVLKAAKQPVFFKKIPSIFLMASNGCVGFDLVLPRVIAQATQRQAFQAAALDRWQDDIVVLRRSGRRMDADFMVRRNIGTASTLSGRTILLIGAGTIGSHVAKFLVQSGAGFEGGRLTIVDPDSLTPGNVGRHWLGPSHVERSKATACAEQLKQIYPWADVRAVVANIMAKPELLDAPALVIDATGEEAVSIAVNQHLVARRPRASDAIYAWLVGNGAAVQVLFVSGKVSGTCLKCLRPDLTAPHRFWPLPEGSALHEVGATCGEAAYVPYGVAAPAVAAGLAAQICLEWSRGEIVPTLRTVVLDATAANDVRDCCPPQEPGCPACGGSHP